MSNEYRVIALILALLVFGVAMGVGIRMNFEGNLIAGTCVGVVGLLGWFACWGMLRRDRKERQGERRK